MSEPGRRPEPGEGREVAARDGWFVRAAARVGDLGSPFYAEERQRDVWNEASAVGYQVLTWLGLLAATVAVWGGGTTALPYAMLLVGVVAAASMTTYWYAQALGVDAVEGEGAVVRRRRTLPLVLLLAAFVTGALRASPGEGLLGGMATGSAVGAVLGLAALLLARWRVHRRAGAGS